MAALGLASGVHCAGMCGGIVTAFSVVHRDERARAGVSPRLLVFNGGRISSYALGGALAGTIGSLGWYASGAQAGLSVLASVVLVLVGMHVAGLRGPMRFLESLGVPLWRRIQPIAVSLTKKRGIVPAYAAGLAWGWLPCGMTYSMLMLAATTASAASGAAVMVAFGAGTLPSMVTATIAFERVTGALSKRATFRNLAGALLLAFGLWTVGSGVYHGLVHGGHDHHMAAA